MADGIAFVTWTFLHRVTMGRDAFPTSHCFRVSSQQNRAESNWLRLPSSSLL